MINLRLIAYGVVTALLLSVVGRFIWMSHELKAQRERNEALETDRDNSVISATAKAQIEAEDKRFANEINHTISDWVDYDRLW